MKEHFLESRGVYYRTNEFLSNRETLVFVHGLSGSSSAWVCYEEKFGNEYNILTFDLRGHGKSFKPKKYSEYRMVCFAEDMAELLAYLHITSCSVVSHSLGSLIVLEFLKQHMSLVTKVVFLSPSYCAREGLLAHCVDVLLWLARPLALLSHSKKPGWHIDYTQQYLNSYDWDIPRMREEIRNTGVKIYLYCSKQALQVNYKDFLHKIQVPTLLVHGKRDSIFPFNNSVVMHKEIADSKLVCVDDADHITVINYFDQVSRAVEDFLTKSSTI